MNSSIIGEDAVVKAARGQAGEYKGRTHLPIIYGCGILDTNSLD